MQSAFSFLEGASSIEALCQRVLACGQPGFALTDRNGVYGMPAYLQACAFHGLTPIVGALLDGAEGEVVLLPRSRAAYGALCRVLSARHRAGPGFALVPALLETPSELALLVAEPALLEALRPRGASGLYAELRRQRSPRLEATAAALGVPCVASGAVRFALPHDAERQRVLRAIALKRTVGRLAPGEHDSEGWLRGDDDMAATFWGEAGERALAQARELAEAARFDAAGWGYGVLSFPRWEGDDPRPAAAILRELAFAGARKRYGGVPRRVERRLDHELKLVTQKGFADYFLIVREIVAGHALTCGRGSAAASLIAYALGITHVDPVRHDLFFERFLNAGREQPPDIDIDFPWDERDAVIQRVLARYGERAAMVANHVYLRPRAALREVARSFGLPDREISRVTGRLGGWNEGWATTFRAPRRALDDLGPPWGEVLRLAEEVSGFPRHLSVHPGGVVITPGPLSDHVPVQPAPKGVPILQWEKDGAEEAGLVKIDLLGNRSLAVIRDTLACARGRGHGVPDYADLDATQDPRCQTMLARGESMGCFYVESPAMRQLQQKSGCGDFERLVIHSSIIRPAANEFIRTYLDRLHGKPWEPVHPELERLLQGTFGLMAYQEDVARIAIHLAGFSAHEADRLRKVLSKKTHDYRLADVEARFRAGVRERGVGPQLEEQLWRMLESFAGYSFCKAHSASYALVSFKCCWLRDRYPAEFFAGVISNGGGYYSTLGYLGEARRLGITPQLACVNASDWAWRGEGPRLRVGLCQLRGLRARAGEALLAARAAGGPFRSLAELVGRVPELNRDELTTLARAGALDALPEAHNRAQLHWRIRLLGARGPAGTLFREAALPEDPDPPPVADLDPELRLEHELLAYGIPISCHPLELWSPGLAELDLVPAAELHRHVGRQVRVCGWLVTAKLVHTRGKAAMEFVTLEDTTGLIEVTVFPRVYARGAWDLHAPRPVLIRGRVEQEHGLAGLIASRIDSWRGPCRIAEPRFSLAADRAEEELLAGTGK